MKQPDIRELIKAGTHFGHRTSRWNPKMAPYILKKSNLIHIIDLRESVKGLIVAAKLASAVAGRGEYVLFAATKRQAQSIARREAERCGMPYVSERWPGGLLTNYATIRSRLESLVELEELEQSGQIAIYSKKMISSLRRKRVKIERNLGGVRNMDRLPGLVVVVDPTRERIAAREAAKLNIPTIALVDTEGDPDNIDVVVPGNDDSIGSISIFLGTIADAVLDGLKERDVEMSRLAQAREEAARTPPAQQQAPSEKQQAQEEQTESSEQEEEPPSSEDADTGKTK